MNLDNLKNISKLDREKMLDLLVSFPRQCEDALFIGGRFNVTASYKKSYSNIVFTGLGGSAIGADIIKGYLGNEIDAPIFVNRNYTIPGFVNRNTLLFAISYSGNTEETLSAYAHAKKAGAKIVVVTSGGKLQKLALKNKDALIVIPKGYPPRCALGYSFIPAVAALSKIGLVKNKKDEIKKAACFLENLRKRHLDPGVKGKANISKNIAKKIHGRFPVIYASSQMLCIATRWRGEFAENSKTLSSVHVFPEMNHNEIVGWVNPRDVLNGFTAIILKDKLDLPRIKKRMSITASILKKEEFHVLEIESKGKTLLERMLSLIYIGDFTSFYLAILNKIDPTPVKRISYLKKPMAK